MNIDAFSVEQQQMIISATQGSKIVDFGGGDGGLMYWLLRHGAAEALVIDKERYDHRAKHSDLRYIRCYFRDITEDLSGYDTAMVCRPINHLCSMEDLIFRLIPFRRIIYIGLNDESTATGMPVLFAYFLHRKLELYIENYPYRLMIYGEEIPKKREPVKEELAGLNADVPIVNVAGIAKLEFK